MKKIKSLNITGLLLTMFCSVGCTKFVTVDPPTTQLVTTSVFDNDQTATSAMNGIYSFLQSNSAFASGTENSVGFLTGLSSDELTNYSTDAEQIQFYKNSLSKNSFKLYSSLWQAPYQCIFDANSVIEGLASSTTVTVPLRQELKGEALFIRAFCHFYLVNLFGDVPLIDTTDYNVNAVASRRSQQEVYDHVISDLEQARTMLSKDYSYSSDERVRPNYFTATALLSRVYLYAGLWSEASAAASEVIGASDLFELLPDLDKIFLKNSREAIWQLRPNQPQRNTGEGNIFILTAAPTYATLSPLLLNAFESGDQRRLHWVGDTTIGENTYFYPFKYKVKGSNMLTEYSMIFRLAEQYLIRAEAELKQNQIMEALDDLNIIRERAGLNSLSSTDTDSVLAAITQERRVELFTEWGHRWLDLKRTGQASAELSPFKTGWNDTDILFPIPQREIQRDPFLTQNNGY